MQRRAAQGAMGGFCGPLASLELQRAPRSARRETVKGRDAAVSRATRDAPRWSDASRLLSKSRDDAARCARRDAPRWRDAMRLWAAVQL